MKKSVMLGLMLGILAAVFVQGVSAYVYYEYSPEYRGRLYVSLHDDDYPYRYGGYYGRYRYYDLEDYHERVEDYWDSGDFDEEAYCRYWDHGDLEWDRDRVCEWINKGDRREQVLRTRAAIWQSNSFDNRYNIQSGRSSGDAFYYHYGDKSETKPSDWRYKRAYDPRVDNERVMGHGYYYYEPRYDPDTGTYNWRF